MASMCNMTLYNTTLLVVLYVSNYNCMLKISLMDNTNNVRFLSFLEAQVVYNIDLEAVKKETLV